MPRRRAPSPLAAIIAVAGLAAAAPAARAQCGAVKLVDDNPNALSFMGSRSAMGTRTLVLGAPASGQGGRIVIFERTETGVWDETGEIVSPLAATNDGYARAVAYYSGYVAVGAPLTDVGADTDTGRVYIYQITGAGWVLDQTLDNPSPDDDDLFGYSLAFTRINDAIVLAVGVPGDDITGAADAGRVRIYYRNPVSGWLLEETLISTDADAGEFFGGAVSLSPEHLLVGAEGENYSGLTDAGAAYLFEHSPGFIWNNGVRILAPFGDRDTADYFGRSVVVSGDRLAIAAPADDNPGDTDCGAVFMYRYNPITFTWSFNQRIVQPFTSAFSFFGTALDLEGDLLLVGDPNHNSAFAFRPNLTDNWFVDPTLAATAPPASGAHSFGSSVAISADGDHLVVGDAQDDINGSGGAGSAYVFLADDRPGDDCAGGILTVPPLVPGETHFGCTGGDNDGFTLCALSSGDKWYQFTAPCAGVLSLSTCGTNDMFGVDTGIDTVISVQRGCPGQTIFLEACNDDAPDGNNPNACYFPADAGLLRDSALRLLVAGGQVYRVRVASTGAAGPFGQFMLHVDFTCCAVDWDNNGVVNSTDVSQFINDWFDDQANGTLQTDINNDGVANSTDVSDFINAWYESC
jgi:hypothetical protein